MAATDSRSSTIVLLTSLSVLLLVVMAWVAFAFVPLFAWGKEGFHSIAMLARWVGYAIGFGCFVAAAFMSFKSLRESNGQASSSWYGTLVGIGLTIAIVSTLIWII